MSKQGYMIITKPSVIDFLCRGWPKNQIDVPEPNSRRVNEALSLATEAKPICVKMTLPTELYWTIKRAKRLFVGWDREELTEEYPVYDQGDPCLVYELNENDFDLGFGNTDWAEWGTYRDRKQRTNQGLRVYWFLYSY